MGILSWVLAGALSLTSWPEDRWSQAVFFAVLEGLYQDGVSTDVVDRVLAADPATGERDLFVYACPLCDPAQEAFRLYQRRPRFRSLKLPVDTFGAGLDPGVVERLRSPAKQDRLDALESLIQVWVTRRLDAMRLTDEERTEWTDAMEARRKVGMQRLGRRTDWKNCAICDGTAGACRRPVQ